MRGAVITLLVCAVASGGCAMGTEPLSDDVPDRTDARVQTGDGPTSPTDARTDGAVSIDASLPIDAAQSIDGGTTGGVDCPADLTYYFRAIDALTLPSPPFCASGSECSTSQCCYGALVCVQYP